MVPGSIFVHTRVEEVEHLCSVLDRSFGLATTIQLDRGKPRIYIRKGSLDRFRSPSRGCFWTGPFCVCVFAVFFLICHVGN